MSDILSEHQGVTKDAAENAPIGYEPTDDEKKAIKLADSLYKEAKAYKARFDYHWLDYYRMFRGKQWKEQRPSYRHSEVINMIFQSIQSTVPLMTDSRPKIEYLPQDPTDRPFSDIMNKVLESDWVSGNWLYKLTENIYDSNIYGTGVAGVLEPKDPGGRIQYVVADPFYCFPDPDSSDVNEGGNYFVYAEPVSIKKLKREYPDLAAYIKPDLSETDFQGQYDESDGTYKSTINDRTLLNGPGQSNTKQPDKALKIILYIKDDSYEEEEIDKKDESGNPVVGADGKPVKEYQQTLKYPNGRKICIASGILLDDCEIPYDDGLFPYARLTNYIDPRMFWGISEVEQLESPQKIFNKLLSFSLDVLTLMGNPIWKVPTSAGIDTDNLYNSPGLVVEFEGEVAPTREEGVQLQPWVMQLADRMKNWFDDMSGSSDVSRGAGADGITAASAIQALQEASKTRIRLKARNMDAFLQIFGEMYASRVMQTYTVPQIFRLTDDQNVNRYFKFYINNDGEKPVAVIRHYNDQGQEGPAQEYQLRAKLDVKVTTGSTLPFGQEERVSTANQAFDRGAIDQQALLEAYDYPNWQAIKDRMDAEKAKQAQMQPQGAPPAQKGAPGP